MLLLVACGGAGNTDSTADSERVVAETNLSSDSAAGGAADRYSDQQSNTAVQSTRDAAKTILFIGTSLTAGYGLPSDSAFPALIQRKIDSLRWSFSVRNAGVSGETSAGALRRLDWLLEQSADVVVLETGANDALRGVDPDSTRENIRAIVRGLKARLPAVEILLLGMEAPRNMGSVYVERFGGIYRDVAREFDIELMPFLLEGVALQSELNQGDGIHPNAAGSRLLAGSVWRHLEPILQRMRRSGG